jgi:transposase-like protein
MPILTPEAWAQMRHDYEHTDKPVQDICLEHGTTPNTLRDRVRRWGWTPRRLPIPAEGPPPLLPPPPPVPPYDPAPREAVAPPPALAAPVLSAEPHIAPAPSAFHAAPHAAWPQSQARRRTPTPR